MNEMSLTYLLISLILVMTKKIRYFLCLLLFHQQIILHSNHHILAGWSMRWVAKQVVEGALMIKEITYTVEQTRTFAIILEATQTAVVLCCQSLLMLVRRRTTEFFLVYRCDCESALIMSVLERGSVVSHLAIFNPPRQTAAWGISSASPPARATSSCDFGYSCSLRADLINWLPQHVSCSVIDDKLSHKEQ